MNQKKNKKFIFLVGGLTAGPLTPLAAIAKTLIDADSSYIPVIFDVPSGVGHSLAGSLNWKSHKIVCGKIRRYFSWKNFFTPVLILLGFFQALYFLIKYKPALVLGAGGFVQVPVLWAAFLLRIPVLIHQQDIIPSLSNLLCMAISKLITVSFEPSVKSFFQGSGVGVGYLKSNKVFWTGNPQLHPEVKKSAEEIKNDLKLDLKLPTILVVGGSTGAMGLNFLVWQDLEKLLNFANVIHQTGKDKLNPDLNFSNYVQKEFIANIAEWYKIADIVISRAGANNITNLVTFQKAAIILPMPDSHQEANASYVYNHHAAAVFDQSEIDLAKQVRSLLLDGARQKQYLENLGELMPKTPEQEIVKLIYSHIFHEQTKA